MTEFPICRRKAPVKRKYSMEDTSWERERMMEHFLTLNQLVASAAWQHLGDLSASEVMVGRRGKFWRSTRIGEGQGTGNSPKMLKCFRGLREQDWGGVPDPIKLSDTVFVWESREGLSGACEEGQWGPEGSLLFSIEVALPWKFVELPNTVIPCPIYTGVNEH